MDRISSGSPGCGRGADRFRGLVVAIAVTTLLAAGRASAYPIYRWQFSEWREVELLGGPAAKLVREPRHERFGDYLLETRDLVAPSFLGDAALLTAVGHSDGKIFSAKAIAPLRGGIAGNTIGGETFAGIALRCAAIRAELGGLDVETNALLEEALDLALASFARRAQAPRSAAGRRLRRRGRVAPAVLASLRCGVYTFCQEGR